METKCSNCDKLKRRCEALDYILCRFMWHDGAEDDLFSALYDPCTFSLDGKDPFLEEAVSALDGEARFIHEDNKLSEMNSEEIAEAHSRRKSEREMCHKAWIEYQRREFYRLVKKSRRGNSERLQELR